MSFGIQVYNEEGINIVPRLPLYKYDTPLIPCSSRTVGVTQVWTIPASHFQTKGSLLALRLPENEWYNWNISSGYLEFHSYYGSTYQPRPSFRVVSPSHPLPKPGYGLQVFDETGKVLLDSDTELVKFASSDLIVKTVRSDGPSIFIGSNSTDNGYIMLQSLMGGIEIIDVREDLWTETRLDIMRVGRNYYARLYYATDPHAHYPSYVTTTLRLKGAFAD